MDKCGPKGARIRCSCCNAVFVVRPPAEPPAGPTPPAPPPALAGLDLVTPSRAAQPAKPPLPLDPFAPAPLGAAQALAASLDGERDPFAPAPPPQVVPDLDALLGGVPAPSAAQIGWGEIDLGTPPAPAPIAPARGAAPVPPPLPSASAPSPFPTPPPLPAATPPPVPQAAEPEAAPADASDVRARRPSTPQRAAQGEPAETASPRPAVTPAPRSAPGRGRAQRERGGRGARALEGALSLALLLGLAAAIFLARGAGRGASASALVRGGAAMAGAAPFTLAARAGVYDTAAGPEVVVVRGTVAARAGSEGPVRVTVELVDGEQAVARGDALAGALPTPEEVYAAGTAEGAAALRRAASARASPRLAPGAPAPFAVVLADVPPDLRRLEVRAVAAAAAREPRPR